MGTFLIELMGTLDVLGEGCDEPESEAVAVRDALLDGIGVGTGAVSCASKSSSEVAVATAVAVGF